MFSKNVAASLPKVEEWLRSAISRDRIEAAKSGRAIPEYELQVRDMGRPAASGCRQVLVMCTDMRASKAAAACAWSWWVDCPTHVDPRGWRNVACRWFRP